MTEPHSPSPVVRAFSRALREALPPTQLARLEAIDAGIETTTDTEDPRRARRCAHWAIEVAGEKELSHPEWRKIRETHEVWKDLWFGVEFAAMGYGDGRPAPIEDVEVEWVENAARVATIVGTTLGWEHAPWEDLLHELIEMEPDGHRPDEVAHEGAPSERRDPQ